MMGDITDRRTLVIKGALLAVLGGLASTLLLVERPGWRPAALLALAVWAFCRAYYFAFYVIEHYIDGEFRFAGLGSAVAHLWRTRGGRGNDAAS